MSALKPAEKIKKAYALICAEDNDLLKGAAVSLDPETFEQSLAQFYDGERLAIAIDELAKRLVYVLGLKFYGQPQTAHGSVADALNDARRILNGNLHLVDCIIEDPKELVEFHRNLEAFTRMQAGQALQAAFEDPLRKRPGEPQQPS